MTADKPGIFDLELTTATQADLKAARSAWSKQFADPLRSTWREHQNTRDSARKIRVGYVSADFREHSAAAVFGAMLVYFDRDRFEVFAYYNATINQGITRIFQENVTCWRVIHGNTDDEVAAMIRKDKIDILIDLGGYSGGNRLLTFAHKPAPIQITAWGYASGTGLAAMDYFFTDRISVPENERHYYTEKIIYLPVSVPYYCQIRLPQVNALPALKNGYITFGLFNRKDKISAELVSTVAQIMDRVPTARLIVKCGDPPPFPGIDPARITFIGSSPKFDHLAACNLVDIALDSFPHCGGVTSLECLIMGLPIVTLYGKTIPGRATTAQATILGMKRWIATTPQEYADIAVEMAGNTGDLSRLRSSLRNSFYDSWLGNNAAYCAAVEQEYELLFTNWCRS